MGQATRITGVVTDAKTGQPVPFATVRYEGKTVGTTTAYDGKYSIVRMDGTLICGHGDEDELVFGTGLPMTASGADYLSCRIYGELTPLSVEDLAAFMRGHPGFYVFTDVKSDNLRVCRRLAEAFPDLRSRFIVQIQLPEEYETLRDGEWVRYEA